MRAASSSTEAVRQPSAFECRHGRYSRHVGSLSRETSRRLANESDEFISVLKQGSWPNVAEIDLAALAVQRMGKCRIDSDWSSQFSWTPDGLFRGEADGPPPLSISPVELVLLGPPVSVALRKVVFARG